MKNLFLVLALFLILYGASRAYASNDTIRITTIVKHDTVFIDRLIIENPEAIKRLTEPYSIKISTSKKICGWAMVTSGFLMEIFTIVNLTSDLNMDNYVNRGLRYSGFHSINICLSAGLIAAGASMLFK